MKRLLVAAMLLGLANAADKEAKKKDAPAEEKKLEYIRVDEDAKAARLQTSVVTLEKDGRKLDLVGAVHIADKKYYEQLNERFKAYDRVLFEMVGGENLNKEAKEEKDADAKAKDKPAEKENKLSGLREIYTTVANFLQLTGQSEHVDYAPANFVHADMTMEEFTEAQKERKESLLGLALKASLDPKAQQNLKQPNTAKLLMAMMSGNSNAMKLELVHTLGQGDDQIGMFAGETVILDDRNDKCLEILEQQLAEGHKNLAIFYGAAHFPSMEKDLAQKGWKRTKDEWVTAWDIPKPKKKPAAKPLPDQKAQPAEAAKKKAA